LISVETLLRFRAALAQHVTPATVNKHLRHVSALLSKAGPAGPHNRDAMGVVNSIAWCKPLREQRMLPRVVSAEDFDFAYHRAPTPYWRAVFACGLLLGYRRLALLSITDVDITWLDGVVHLSADRDKCHRARAKPMHSVVRRHLLALRDRPGLLKWNYSDSWFGREWNRITDNRFGLHDLKRTLGTFLARRGASEWAVRYMLDHSSSDVTGRSYVNPVEEVRDCLERLVLPSCLNDERKLSCQG
jgi:hypothetical protein